MYFPRLECFSELVPAKACWMQGWKFLSKDRKSLMSLRTSGLRVIELTCCGFGGSIQRLRPSFRDSRLNGVARRLNGYPNSMTIACGGRKLTVPEDQRWASEFQLRG